MYTVDDLTTRVSSTVAEMTTGVLSVLSQHLGTHYRVSWVSSPAFPVASNVGTVESNVPGPSIVRVPGPSDGLDVWSWLPRLDLVAKERDHAPTGTSRPGAERRHPGASVGVECDRTKERLAPWEPRPAPGGLGPRGSASRGCAEKVGQWPRSAWRWVGLRPGKARPGVTGGSAG